MPLKLSAQSNSNGRLSFILTSVKKIIFLSYYLSNMTNLKSMVMR